MAAVGVLRLLRGDFCKITSASILQRLVSPAITVPVKNYVGHRAEVSAHGELCKVDSARILQRLARPTFTVPVKHYAGPPDAASAHGNHTIHWNAERIVSLVLLGAIPGSFIIQAPFMNLVLATALGLHVHWGMEVVVVDYIRPAIFGPTIPKIALGGLYALSIVTFAGLCYFNYNDVGIINAVKIFWSL